MGIGRPPTPKCEGEDDDVSALTRLCVSLCNSMSSAAATYTGELLLR